MPISVCFELGKAIKELATEALKCDFIDETRAFMLKFGWCLSHYIIIQKTKELEKIMQNFVAKIIHYRSIETYLAIKSRYF